MLLLLTSIALCNHPAHTPPEVVQVALHVLAALVVPGLVKGTDSLWNVRIGWKEVGLRIVERVVVEPTRAVLMALALHVVLAALLKPPLGVHCSQVVVQLLLALEELALVLLGALLAVVVKHSGVLVTLLAVDGGAPTLTEVHGGGDLGVLVTNVSRDDAGECGHHLGAVGYWAIEPGNLHVRKVALEGAKVIKSRGSIATTLATAIEGLSSSVSRHKGRE
jgi:hypothetical protein